MMKRGGGGGFMLSVCTVCLIMLSVCKVTCFIKPFTLFFLIYSFILNVLFVYYIVLVYI